MPIVAKALPAYKRPFVRFDERRWEALRRQPSASLRGLGTDEGSDRMSGGADFATLTAGRGLVVALPPPGRPVDSPDLAGI